MKQILSISALATLFLLTSCASSNKDVTEKEDSRERQLDYKIIDWTQGYKSFPEWVNEPNTKNGDKKSERDANKYFVANSEQIKNKRLCLKSAEARGAAQIAAEITQVIKNDFGEAMQGESKEDAEDFMSETLAQEAMAFLTGVSTVKTYWEKRKYLTTLGAEEDLTAYSCWALVKIDRTVLKKAVNNAIKKFTGAMENTETKKMVKDALKDTAAKMDNMTNPVKVTKEE